MQEFQTCHAGTPLSLYHPPGPTMDTPVPLSQRRKRQGHTVCFPISQKSILSILHVLSRDARITAQQEGTRGNRVGLQQSYDWLETSPPDTRLRGEVIGIHTNPDATEARGTQCALHVGEERGIEALSAID